MIFPDQAARIVIATKPVDFRKGHDGLAAMAPLAVQGVKRSLNEIAMLEERQAAGMSPFGFSALIRAEAKSQDVAQGFLKRR